MSDKLYKKNGKYKNLLILILLSLLIIALYYPVRNFSFVNLDDPVYISENYNIQSCTALGCLSYAFTDTSTSMWTPVVLLSHMLDWKLFGNNTGGHHWTSVIIHILNTLLLFIFLHRVTGSIWPSAIVATLFAVHPMNVESVAWISERKNVLSTFFWIATMMFYVWYVKQPTWKRYLPLFIIFALGLMSKPMLVTLPFVLLLLDYWPLHRTTINFSEEKYPVAIKATRETIFSLILEKVPLLLLVLVFVILTIYSVKSVGASFPTDTLTLMEKIKHVIYYYGFYVYKLFIPINLTVFHPYSFIPVWQAILSLILLLSMTIVVIALFRKVPYLPVGWFWYLGTLVPVIGFVQVCTEAMADRYAYIPSIGIFICLSFGIPQLIGKLKYAKILLVSISIFSILIMAQASYQQIKIWENDITLFEHVTRINADAYVAYNILGTNFEKKGEYEKALYYYYLALKKNPQYATAYINVGNTLQKMGNTKAAEKNLKKAIEINSNLADAYYNLGVLYLQTNQNEDALNNLSKALGISNSHYEYHINIGVAFARKGNIEKAKDHLEKALRLNPNSNEAKRNYKIIMSLNEE